MGTEQQRTDRQPVGRVGDDERDELPVVGLDQRQRRQRLKDSPQRNDIVPKLRQRHQHCLVGDEDPRDKQDVDTDLPAPTDRCQPEGGHTAKQPRENCRRHNEDDAVDKPLAEPTDGTLPRLQGEFTRSRHQRLQRREIREVPSVGFGADNRGHQSGFDRDEIERPHPEKNEIQDEPPQ